MSDTIKPMHNKEKKIVSEWVMLPEYSKQLGKTIAENIGGLKNGDATALKALKQVIQQTFPEGTLPDLYRAIHGETDVAFLIRGLPEASKNTFDRETPDASDSYTFHICKALYEMSGIETAEKYYPLARKSHTDPDEGIHGPGIHKDHTPDGDGRSETVIGLMAPINDEGAKTSLIPLQKILETIPEDELLGTSALVFKRGNNANDFISLSEALNRLRDPEQNYPLQSLTFPAEGTPVTLGNASGDEWRVENHNNQHNINAINAKISEGSTPVELAPGSLLIWNERNLFHQAHQGAPQNIAAIPSTQTLSRFAIHVAGKVLPENTR